MTEFTVEIYGNPVSESDENAWDVWRQATDVVPGTILLEDPDEPCLIFPIDATALNEAAIFAQGVMASLGLDIRWGRAYPVEGGIQSVSSPNIPDYVPSWLVEDALISA